MAEKKTATKKKVAPKKKAPAKKKVAAKKTESASTAEDLVTLAQLADEAGIGSASVRQKLRTADLARPEGKRWGWKPGSKELAAAKKALGI